MQSKEIEDMRRKIEKLERRKIEQETIRKQLLLRLKTEFGVETIEGARALHKDLTAKCATNEASVEARYNEFAAKHRDQLAGV